MPSSLARDFLKCDVKRGSLLDMCWSCSHHCVWYFFILYCTPSSFITLHSYGMHTTYFGILLLHHHYTFSYDASGIHSSFLAYINLLCLTCITSVVYLLRLRCVTLL